MEKSRKNEHEPMLAEEKETWRESGKSELF